MRFSLDRSTCHGARTELEVLKCSSILYCSSKSDSELKMDEHVRTSITSLSWMCDEEGPVSLSVSSFSWMSDEERPVSLCVSSLPWIRDEEGPGVSLSISSFSWMSGEEGHLSLSVSSLSWMCEEEGPVSLTCPGCVMRKAKGPYRLVFPPSLG